MQTAPDEQLKDRVRSHWTEEPCGTRGVDGSDRRAFFAAMEAERDQLEPFIAGFARFHEGKGKKVLEVGVGPGNDFIRWVRAGAVATGVDLTAAGIALTKERVALEGLQADLQQADAEQLPFADNTFDIVYSYGVLHHTPDTNKSVAEVFRVLKPGGIARLMLYQNPSITGVLLWAVHGLGKGKPWMTPREAVYEHLESPGTKSYSFAELDVLLAAFEQRTYQAELLGGDLLSFRPSKKYPSAWHKAAFRLYPTQLVRKFGRRFGHAILIEARKPS